MTVIASLLLATPSALPAAGRDHELWIVDSRGQPADDLAEEAWRQSRHRRSRVTVRWIRIGVPWDPMPSSGPTSPEDRKKPPPPIEPEWDMDGELTRHLELEGLPRLILLDPAGSVMRRETFLPTSALRYLCRHPTGPPGG